VNGVVPIDDRRIVVHIGPPKTGTTWLQRSVLPHFDDVHVPLTPEGVRECLSLRTPETFEPLDVHRRLEGALKSSASAIVISDERLAGPPIGHQFERTVLARRVCGMFPNARILITTRSQPSAIASLYRHYVTWNNETGRIEDFLAQSDGVFGRGFDWAYYDYESLARQYGAQIGDDRVHILPLELSRADLSAYLQRLAGVLGVAPPEAVSVDARNEGIHDVCVPVMRAINVITGQTEQEKATGVGGSPLLRFPGRGFGRRVLRALSRRARGVLPSPALERRVHHIVGDAFSGANMRLEERSGLSLSGLGYPVA
jgi:hypothetical protein